MPGSPEKDSSTPECGPVGSPTVVDLKGTDFTYRGAAGPTLIGLDLRLRPGQMQAVLGAQGSGTSTLCRLVVGLLGDRGTLGGAATAAANTVMLGDDPEAQLSGMATLVGDEVQLPSRLHGHEPAAARARAAEAMTSLVISDLWERSLDTLSGGQRQLVPLAGLLALDPALLVLDEPGLSLDPAMRRRLVAALSDFARRGGSVLITGHQFDEVAAACDRVSLLAAGVLGEPRTPADLREADLAESGVWVSCPALPRRGSGDDVAGEEDRRRDPVLTIDRLTVEWGSHRVLDGLDLVLRPGEFTALMGANGAGKSTLLRSILGLLDGTATVGGTMTVRRLGEDIDLTVLPTHRRAGHIGWVGQHPGTQLSAATVREELRRAAPLPRHRRRDRGTVRAQREAAIDAIMDTVGLAEAADVHPFDLGTDGRKDVVIGTSLVAEPRILLLDEPTQGRDLAGMARLDRIVAEFLARGGAVLAATHDQQWAAASAHQRLRLADGRIARMRDPGI